MKREKEKEGRKGERTERKKEESEGGVKASFKW